MDIARCFSKIYIYNDASNWHGTPDLEMLTIRVSFASFCFRDSYISDFLSVIGSIKTGNKSLVVKLVPGSKWLSMDYLPSGPHILVLQHKQHRASVFFPSHPDDAPPDSMHHFEQ